MHKQSRTNSSAKVVRESASKRSRTTTENKVQPRRSKSGGYGKRQRSSHYYANTWVRVLLATSWHCYHDFRAAGLFLPCLMQAHQAHACTQTSADFGFGISLTCSTGQDLVFRMMFFEFAARFIELAGVSQVFGMCQHRIVEEGRLRMRDSGIVVSFYI